MRRQIKAVANGRPRLSVHRTSKNIYAQIIDDAHGKTLASASTLDADFKTAKKTGADSAAASHVGKLVAERAKKAGVSEVVFDRGAWEGTGVQVKDSMIIVGADGSVFDIAGGIEKISRPDIEERIRKAIKAQV